MASAHAVLPKGKSPMVTPLVYVLQVYYTKVSPCHCWPVAAQRFLRGALAAVPLSTLGSSACLLVAVNLCLQDALASVRDL